MSIQDWIRKGRELGASDLHIEADTPLLGRVRGNLVAMGAAIPGSMLTSVTRELLGAEAWAQFLSRGSCS